MTAFSDLSANVSALISAVQNLVAWKSSEAVAAKALQDQITVLQGQVTDLQGQVAAALAAAGAASNGTPDSAIAALNTTVTDALAAIPAAG